MKPEHKAALGFGTAAIALGGILAAAAASPFYWVIVGSVAYRAGKHGYQRALLNKDQVSTRKHDEDLFI
jgi:hypothetical protein